MYNNLFYHNFTCIHMCLSHIDTLKAKVQFPFGHYPPTENEENKKLKEDDRKENEHNEDDKPKIKLIKNNKIVYVSESASKLHFKKIKSKKRFTFINRGQRGSRFRGVSRNGNQWQVLIMINKSKSYVGSYSSESLAARIYDIVSLKNHGNKAKTNFDYTKSEISGLVCLDVKDKTIEDKLNLILNDNSDNAKQLKNGNSPNNTYVSCSTSY